MFTVNIVKPEIIEFIVNFEIKRTVPHSCRRTSVSIYLVIPKQSDVIFKLYILFLSI